MAWPASTAPSSVGQRLAEFGLAQVVDERLDRREQDRLRVAEQVFVVFELVELVGERLDLLHLVVDHLDEFGDVPAPC